MSYFESLEVIMMLSGSFMALTYNIFKPEDSTTGTVFARWGWPHTLSIAVIGFYAFVFYSAKGVYEASIPFVISLVVAIILIRILRSAAQYFSVLIIFLGLIWKIYLTVV